MSQVSIIDIEGNHPQIPTEFIANQGSAIPIANILEILGSSVAAGVLPVYTTGAANIITVNVQRAQAIAAPNALNVGLAAFDSEDFSVDATGFVSLLGGGQAIDSINVDTNTFPGTNPVTPNISGEITVTGGQVAAEEIGTNVIRTNSLAANTYTIEIQRSTTNATPNIIKNGVSHFSSSHFVVDSSGFVTASGTGIGQTITGDSGVALPPTDGNWNIFGRSGSKTSGALSTLTIKSPPYADASATATSLLNTGEFVTGAFTRTLPASAGLEDGDLLEYVCTSASALVIQAVGTQQIRVGSLVSSAAGTLTSTSSGDSISLRFRATDGFWYATSVVGTWLVA